MNQSKANTGITVSMIRACVCMGRLLNLTRACEELGATRQTVRRHINDLERIFGGRLFEVVDREYKLTELGEKTVEEAKSILVQIDSWSGQSALKRETAGGLESLQYTDRDGNTFYSQQHPVSKIAECDLSPMKKAFVAWGTAATQIEHDAMREIKPYSVLYRKGPLGWVYVHVGEKSAYAKWFGETMAKSVIGKLITDDNVSDDYDEFMAGAYSRIYDEGGVRFDHILAHLPREDGGLKPGTFQRLLLGGVFPDGTPGLIIIAAITDQVEIDALPEGDRPHLSTRWLVDRPLVTAA